MSKTVFRELPLLYPDYALRYWISERMSIQRGWCTDWRGWLAITGKGRIWAVCQLVNCTAYEAGSYRWGFDELRMIENVIESPVSPLCNRWRTPQGFEPRMLGAWQQMQLNQLLFPESVVIPVLPDVIPEPVETLALF